MNTNYGFLYNESDIKLYRNYFIEVCNAIGIKVKYRSLLPGNHWTSYSEILGRYSDEEDVMCIFNEHPDQRTMKKFGWVSELSQNPAIISVPYNLHDLQVGCLFTLPSGFDNSPGRLFRVTEISSIMMYPASLTCQLVPEYPDTLDQSLKDHSQESFNLIQEESPQSPFLT